MPAWFSCQMPGVPVSSMGLLINTAPNIQIWAPVTPPATDSTPCPCGSSWCRSSTYRGRSTPSLATISSTRTPEQATLGTRTGSCSSRECSSTGPSRVSSGPQVNKILSLHTKWYNYYFHYYHYHYYHYYYHYYHYYHYHAIITIIRLSASVQRLRQGQCVHRNDAQRDPHQDWGGQHCRLQQGHPPDPSDRLHHAHRQHLVLALLCHPPQVPLLLCFKSLRGQGIQTKVICFNFSLMIQSYFRIFPARRSWSAPRLTHLFRTFPTIPFTRRSIPVIKCLARVPRVFLERGQ